MAILADIRRIDMRYIFTGCIRPVVATGAIARDVRMIESRGQPRRAAMAGFALRDCGGMVQRLAVRDAPVVTTAAATEHRAVVNPGDRAPLVGRVAVGTGIGGADMGGRFAVCGGAVMAA